MKHSFTFFAMPYTSCDTKGAIVSINEFDISYKPGEIIHGPDGSALYIHGKIIKINVLVDIPDDLFPEFPKPVTINAIGIPESNPHEKADS
jgi:hypothetical protein